MSLVPISLPNGSIALIELADSGTPGRQISTGGKTYDFSSIGPSLEGVSQVVINAIKAVAPTRATIELSVDFELREGGLVAAFVRAATKGTVKVALEWAKDSSTASDASVTENTSDGNATENISNGASVAG